jgi:hypothetical protein
LAGYHSATLKQWTRRSQVFPIQDLNINVDTKRDVLLSVWGRMPFFKAFGIVVTLAAQRELLGPDYGRRQLRCIATLNPPPVQGR